MRLAHWLAPALLLVHLCCLGCAAVPPVPEVPPQPFATTQAGDTTVIMPNPEAGQCKKCCSIWDFLGVGQIGKGLLGISNRLRARLGSRFPGLEPKPPLTTLTDPANSAADAPPVNQAAAEVKAEQDAAPQQVKAIEFLAKQGCSDCYPAVEDGLLAALDSCVESVRYAAAKALRTTAGNPCQCCKDKACCSEKILKKLDKIANKMSDSGCYEEPSARVRRMARLAMRGCGGATISSTEEPGGGPDEGPTAEDLPAGPAGAAPPEGPPPATPSPAPAAPAAAAANRAGDLLMARVNGQPIYKSQVAPRVQRQLQQLQKLSGQVSTPGLVDSIYRAELQTLIEQALVCQEARRHLTNNQISQVNYNEPLPGQPHLYVSMEDPVLARHWLRRNVTPRGSISEDEVKAYYESNRAQFETAASVKWEQVTLRHSRVRSREQAQAILEFLRNLAAGGNSEVAPPFEPRDVETRRHDWTPLDSIGVKHLSETLFSLPVGQTSAAFEDQFGWHLYRVLERRPAQALSLEDATPRIREKLEQQRRERAEIDYRRKLRDQADVWSIYEPAPTPATRAPMPAGTEQTFGPAPQLGPTPVQPAAVRQGQQMYRLPTPQTRPAGNRITAISHRR